MIVLFVLFLIGHAISEIITFQTTCLRLKYNSYLNFPIVLRPMGAYIRFFQNKISGIKSACYIIILIASTIQGSDQKINIF